MPTASIRIDGHITPRELTLGNAVVFSNLDNTGVLSWQWSILDKPAGSTVSFSSPTNSTVSLVPDKEGSYLVKLSINLGESEATAIGYVSTLLSGIRIPAAFERTEASARGWAASMNDIIQMFERDILLGHVVGAVSGSTMPSGTPVRVVGEFELPNGHKIVSVAPAYGSSAVYLPAIGVTITAATGSNNVFGVRTFGGLTESNVDTSTSTVGAPVYVSDSGTLSLTSGTVSLVVGYVSTVDAAGRVFINPQSNVTPTSGLASNNRNMVASITSGDHSLACAVPISSNISGWISVAVNGIGCSVGDGTRSNVDCYFSKDGGTTPTVHGALTTSDYLYWNGSIARYDLDNSYRIDFIYVI